ncbi:MAG: HAMP domain-containing protein [Anaeromyxobacter sp.]|nr:HAMP domain-containing protein [Anaeromyxobacter sp.]MBL0276415.1 HAMP domain-containing protein [Anaeromyxobacter sp.]
MRLSIRLKLILPLVLGLGLIAVATAVLMRFVHERAVDLAALAELEHAAEALEAQEESEVDRLSALGEAIVGDESLAALLERRDRAGLLAEAGPMFRQLRDAHGVTHWYFHPAGEGGVLLRVHRPELFGDAVRRPTFLRAVETGLPTSGREFGRTAFAVRVVRPWRSGGRLIGYLELGSDIHTFLSRLKRVTGDDYGLLLDKRKLEPAAWAAVTGRPERWDERAELVAITSTTGDDALFGSLGRVAELPAAPTLLSRAHDGDRVVARGAFPLRDGSGEVVGGVVVLHEITPLLGGVAELRLRVVILVVLLAAGLAALVVFLLDTLVFDRVDRMSRTLAGLPERLARGDLEPAELSPRQDDELGRVEAFLDQALAAVGAFVAEARRSRPSDGGQQRRSDRDEP